MKSRYISNIPNIITITRILMAIALIFIYPPLGLISFIVYCIAGSTDIVDGFLARRIPGGESIIGGELDSIADLVLALVGIFVFLPVMEVWDWFRFVGIGIFVVKVLTASISGYIKHKRPIFLATTMNKAAAFLLFLCPIIYFFIGAGIIVNMYLIFLIVIFSIAITEEVIINLTLNKPNKSIKGVWKVKEENRKYENE